MSLYTSIIELEIGNLTGSSKYTPQKEVNRANLSLIDMFIHPHHQIREIYISQTCIDTHLIKKWIKQTLAWSFRQQSIVRLAMNPLLLGYPIWKLSLMFKVNYDRLGYEKIGALMH